MERYSGDEMMMQNLDEIKLQEFLLKDLARENELSNRREHLQRLLKETEESLHGVRASIATIEARLEAKRK